MELDRAYDILGVSFGASPEEVESAYQVLALAWHPDRFREGDVRDRAAARMKEINEAAAVIRSTPRPHVRAEAPGANSPFPRSPESPRHREPDQPKTGALRKPKGPLVTRLGLAVNVAFHAWLCYTFRWPIIWAYAVLAITFLVFAMTPVGERTLRRLVRRST